MILRVLGGGWLEGRSSGLRITARKKIALLSFLALDRQTAPRDLLAGLIWGDVPDDKAKASLRQALSELRASHPALRAALTIDRTAVTLMPGYLTLETQLVLEDIASGRLPTALRGGGETVGDILYGFETIGERFADWTCDIRKSFRDRFLASLSEAANRDDLSADIRMEMAEAALAIEPMGERQCRFAMRLASDLGDIGKALQIYAAFYARMEAELGMEPSLQTQDLAVQIKMSGDDARPAPTSASTARPAPRQRAPQSHGRPVLAILPMKAAGPEPIDDFLAEMLVDNMVLRVTRTRDISVISRVSFRHLTGRSDIASVLQEKMGAGYIISGHIRRAGDQYFLNVELSKTDDGQVLWAERYETSAADLGASQSRIADEVVGRILPNLHLNELSTARLNEVNDLSAYQKLLRAQELVYTLSKPSFTEAGRQLQEICALWPDFVPARVGLADWHSLAMGQAWSEDGKSDLAAISEHLKAALDRDRRNGRALAMLGHNHAIYTRSFNDALALFDEALATSPGDAETLLWTGPALAFVDQEDKAISQLERARALNYDNPLGFRYDHFLAIAYYAAGRMEDAVRLGMASFVRNNRYISNLRLTAAALCAIDDEQGAREMTSRILAIEPDFSVARLVAAHPFRNPAKRAEYGVLLARAGLPS